MLTHRIDHEIQLATNKGLSILHISGQAANMTSHPKELKIYIPFPFSSQNISKRITTLLSPH